MTNFLDLPPELRDLVYGFYFTDLLHEYRGSDKYHPTLLRTSKSISVEAAETGLRIIAAAANAATQEVGYQVDELHLSRSEMNDREHAEIVGIINQIIDCAAPGQSRGPEWRTHGWIMKLEDMAEAHKALIARLAKK